MVDCLGVIEKMEYLSQPPHFEYVSNPSFTSQNPKYHDYVYLYIPGIFGRETRKKASVSRATLLGRNRLRLGDSIFRTRNLIGYNGGSRSLIETSLLSLLTLANNMTQVISC
jgi:hypothetical protein